MDAHTGHLFRSLEYQSVLQGWARQPARGCQQNSVLKLRLFRAWRQATQLTGQKARNWGSLAAACPNLASSVCKRQMCSCGISCHLGDLLASFAAVVSHQKNCKGLQVQHRAWHGHSLHGYSLKVNSFCRATCITQQNLSAIVTLSSSLLDEAHLAT